MLLDAIEAHVPQAPADARDRVGPILRVGIPTTGASSGGLVHVATPVVPSM